MTKERMKTTLLISLFMVSIFLANQIWIELPESFFPSFGEDLYDRDSQKLFSDIVSPEEYLINFNGNKHTVLYSDKEYQLWAKGRMVLANILKSQNLVFETIDSDEFNSYREGLSLDYFFSEKLHVYLLSKTLEVDLPNSIADEIEKVDDIHISLGKEPFIVFSNGDVNLKIKTAEKTNILDAEISSIRKTITTISKEKPTQYFTMEYMFQIDNQQYVPINMNYSLPNIYLTSEIDMENEDIDDIARHFFKKLDYTRRIVEANGSIIYIYDQEVLKIYQDGMVEYSNLNEETVRSRELYKSLNTAIDFITEHLGWPSGSYLKSIDLIEFQDSKGYRFRFMYKVLGAQLMLNKEHSMEAPIEIEVFNDYVKSYKRLVRTNSTLAINNQGRGNMLSPYKILSDTNNFEFIKSKYIEKNGLADGDMSSSQIENDILSSIDSVYLAYSKTTTRKFSSDLELTLTPVWVIEIDGITFMFDSYSGIMIDGAIIGGIIN